VLSVVRAPSATVVATISSTKSAVVATIGVLLLLLLLMLLLLVASATLVPQSTEAAVLAALTTTLQVTRVAAEALLVCLLGSAALSALAGAVVCGGSRSARLRSKSRGARPSTLVVAERLQRIFVSALLAGLLLAIRVLASVTALRSGEHIWKPAKAARSSCSAVLSLRCTRY